MPGLKRCEYVRIGCVDGRLIEGAAQSGSGGRSGVSPDAIEKDVDPLAEAHHECHGGSAEEGGRPVDDGNADIERVDEIEVWNSKGSQIMLISSSSSGSVAACPAQNANGERMLDEKTVIGVAIGCIVGTCRMKSATSASSGGRTTGLSATASPKAGAT